MPMNITDQPIGARNAWLKSAACQRAYDTYADSLAGEGRVSFAEAQRTYYRLRDNFFRQYAEGKQQSGDQS